MAGPILAYLACPTRLGLNASDRSAMISYAAGQGRAPIHPHAALSNEVYEFGVISRADTMEVCYRIIDMCDEFWVCGISEGVLLELRHFFETGQHRRKPLRLLASRFDPHWARHAKALQDEHGDALSRLGLLSEKA